MSGGLAALLALQRPSGAFPSSVGEGEDVLEDETCFVTASVALLLAPLPDGGGGRAAGERALDFVERCERPEAPGAFGFYPADPSSPRVVHGLPPDADDTALAWLALLAAGRRTPAEARAAFRACIGPSSRRLVPGDAPPWTRPGAVRTWLVERGRDNPVDLVVNANVAALAARIGETAHPAFAGACATLLAAARGGYPPVAFARRLAPFYASICELGLAVSRAVALGAGALAPCLAWLADADRGDDPLRPDKPLYCNAHGSPVWRAPALQLARSLAAARPDGFAAAPPPPEADMTWFPTAVLEAAESGTTPVLRVSTKYMETFLPVRPVSSGTEIHTFVNRAGVLDLYSVGTDAQVYRLRRGQAAAAPYEQTRLGIAATQLYPFTAAGGDADTPSIFGLDAQGRLSLSSWQAGVGYVQKTTQPARATGTIRRFLGVRGSTGRIYINVRLDDGRLGVNYYDLVKQAWGGEVWAPVKGPDGQPAMVKDIAMATNNPVQRALFAIGMDDEVLFSEESFNVSQLRKLNKKASRLTVVTDAEKLLCVFAVELGTGLLWLKRQRKYSVDGIQFDDWIRVDPSQDVGLTTLRANQRLDGLVEVFAGDVRGDLRYTRQRVGPDGKPAGWAVLFPLRGGCEAAIFTTGRNASGYSEAYSVTRDSEVYRFWQSPESEQWFTERLEVPRESGELVPVPTHAAEIVVVDGQGLPLVDAAVVVNAAFLTTLWVDGVAYRASLVDPVALKTGANGRIVLHQRATALAAATLLVQTPATPAGAPVKVEPNAQLQHKLAQLDARQILDAKDASGRLLLPPDTKDRDKVAESIARITARSMEIAQADERAAPVQYKFAARRGARFQHRLDLAALGETAWEIDFTAGYPQYRDLTVADARAYRADRLAAAGEAGGILDIDWGAAWEGFKSGVVWLFEGIARIVVTIVDGIATVLFEIAGKIFEAILEVAQQALDLIEGVWSWLKVKLQQLYEWLAYLFDFKDFDRTAQGVKHTVGVFLDFTADAVHHIRGQVDQGFTSIKENLETVVDDFVGELNGRGDPSLGGYFREMQPSDDQAHANDHNIFFNAFQENQHAVKLVGGGGAALLRPAALDDPLAGLLAKMKQLADNFEFGDGKQAFDEALGYFDMVGSDRDRALQLVLSGLVKVLEGVALFALDAARGVVLTLLDLVEAVIRLVRDALFEAWEIPIVSQLYKLFTGESLTITPVDVMAWIVAIPSTILSKVVLGRSPFPDQAALDRFRSEFTADMLRRRIGLMGEAEAAAAVDDWSAAWRHNFLIGYCCAVFIRGVGETGQVIGNSQGKGLGRAGIVPILLKYATTAFTAPWALSAAAGAPSCTPGTPGFGVTIWICQLLFGPTRGLLVFAQPWIDGEAKIYLGEGTLTLWGVANLIMRAWDFAEGPQQKADKLAFGRSIAVVVPGQTLRVMSVPAVNVETYYIPVGILAVLTVLGFFGSFGVAIEELKDTA